MGISGRFVDGAAGRILLVSHDTVDRPVASVVVFPALAEEMNKSRRLLWSVGRQLAARGIMTVVPDLFGTGDSEGEFRDASWDAWCGDMAATINWARAQADMPVHALLVRFGACLYSSCASLLDDAGDAHRIAAWQPELSGATAMRQLLRMKVMADRVTWGRSTKLKTLQEALVDDSAPTEIGGYEYAAGLANSINAAKFDWSSLTEAATGCLFDWTRGDDEDGGPDVVRVQVEGQRFWSAVEPGDHPELVADTVSFLAGEA